MLQLLTRPCRQILHNLPGFPYDASLHREREMVHHSRAGWNQPYSGLVALNPILLIVLYVLIVTFGFWTNAKNGDPMLSYRPRRIIKKKIGLIKKNIDAVLQHVNSFM